MRLKLGTNGTKSVKIKDSELNRGTLVMGSPGTGKSELLKRIAYQLNLLFKCAIIIIDPSGFFAREVYSIFKGKAHYCSLQNSISINPLVAPYEPYQHVYTVIEIINQVVNLTTDGLLMSHRMRSILAEATLYCLEHDKPRFDAIRNNVNKGRGHRETRDGIVGRLDMLVMNKSLNRILCGQESIDWGTFIDNGEILIADCHGMSTDEMIIFGSTITHSLRSYFRYKKREEYKQCIVIVDECHNFISTNWLDIVKEGRKYSLGAILSTQDVANVEKRLIETILSDVGSILAFSSGFRETQLLAREFRTLDFEDIFNLPKYHIAYRLSEEEGIAKTRKMYPVREIEPPTSGKCLKEKPVSKWFPLKPCPASDNHIGKGKVVVEAEAETSLS